MRYKAFMGVAQQNLAPRRESAAGPADPEAKKALTESTAPHVPAGEYPFGRDQTKRDIRRKWP
jgi:hypothetical protein